MSQIASTVFVIDDDAAVRKSLVRLLREAGYTVEGFASAEEFLARERKSSAGGSCLVLDVGLPGLDGLELQEALTLGEDEDRLPIIFITGHGDIPTSVRAMKKGAVDFLIKPFTSQTLISAVGLALRQDQEARAQRAEVAEIRRRVQTLTPRECDVMERVITGMLNKQIATDLGIEVGTVKVHRARMMEKMGVRSVAKLVSMAAVGLRNEDSRASSAFGR